jgi:hypothetical protein
MKKIVMSLMLIFISTTYISAKTAGTVNGIVITIKEANKALDIVTNGKMTWDKLPLEGKKQLLQMIAPSKLVALKSKKGLTKKEKEAALASFWMQKQISKVKISDKEAKAVYKKMKKSQSKQKIPPFKLVKNNIKMQLAQKKVISRLMKNAKIKIK